MKIEEQIGDAQIAGWQKWVLSLDKYIDPNDQPKKHRYALLAGGGLGTLFYLLMLFIGLPSESALALLVGVFLIEIVFHGGCNKF